MRKAESHGAKISFDDVGTGDVALLSLPGWCGSRAMFSAVTPRLANDFRVLALDWRGHGDSSPATSDFGQEENVRDAQAVIAACGAARIVPVAGAHAGWVAIDLLRHLGPSRVPAIVLIDWLVLEPPPPFMDALRALQDPAQYAGVREALFQMWLGKSGNAEVDRYLREDMASYDAQMWGRAAREIAAAYEKWKNPLEAIARLNSGARVLHLYAQPEDPGYLAAQRAFAEKNPWFTVERLEGKTHFPSIEMPGQVASSITSWLR